MSELIRNSFSENMIIQCIDEKTSFFCKKHQLSLNLNTGGISVNVPTNIIKKIKSLVLNDKEAGNLKTETEKTASILAGLRNELDGSAHFKLTLNLKHVGLYFSNGALSQYNQAIGRLALCHNGDVRFCDFGVDADYSMLDKLVLAAYNKISPKKCANSHSGVRYDSIPKPAVFILKPQAASFFVHEVLGHVLEQDNWDTQHSLINVQKRVLPAGCEVVDDPINSKFLSYGTFDDSGNETKRTTVISDGFICERISLMRSAEYTQIPQNRMSSFSLFNRHKGRSFDEILNDHKRCVIIEEISNGGLNPHTGDYFISSSKQYYCGSDAQEQVLLPCTYLGRIGDLCDSIIEVGGDYTSSIGICSKKQQNLFVNNGSPSIALSQLEVLA